MTRPLIDDRLAATWPTDLWCDVHVVVAVSGGADSIALLRLLHAQKIRRGGNGQLYVCHVDHALRAEESEEDKRCVATLCQQLSLPLVERTADVQRRAEQDGDGVEAAARAERYALLGEVAESLGARYVAVGHHADDQLETVLMRLFRGAGLRGLRGMLPTRPLSPSVTLVRPLLSVTRAELLNYLKSVGQSFRTDSSNLDPTFDRNRLRNELMPAVRDCFRSDPGEMIARTTEQLAAAQVFVEEQAAALAARCRAEITRGQQITLATPPLEATSRFLVIETLRLLWRDAHFPEQAMTYDHWMRLYDVACSGEGGQTFPGNVVAEVRDRRLSLRCKREC